MTDEYKYEGGIDFVLTDEEKEFCKNATIENVKTINIHRDSFKELEKSAFKELLIKALGESK